MHQFWPWAAPAAFIRLFTDGERRYSQALWPLAHQWLERSQYPKAFPYRKVWRQGWEVACKVKGSQGRPRRVWCHHEHPYTAISAAHEVHANHLEAFNASLPRRCSAYRRRQNLYAKQVEGLKRSVTVLRLVHNWVRVHPSLAKGETPAMKLGLVKRPVTIAEILMSRSFANISS